MLEKKLQEYRINAPTGTEVLAQGDEIIELEFTYRATKNEGSVSTKRSHVDFSWNEIFSLLSPLMLNEAAESELINVINRLIKSKQVKVDGLKYTNHNIVETYFHTLIIQFKALGLIVQSKKNKSVKDTETYWSLTPYGDTIMTQLRAIKRNA